MWRIEAKTHPQFLLVSKLKSSIHSPRIIVYNELKKRVKKTAYNGVAGSALMRLAHR